MVTAGRAFTAATLASTRQTPPVPTLLRPSDGSSRPRALLVLVDESALSLCQRPPHLGVPRPAPLLVHGFNWKRASMAAALCYRVRGGGAQLCCCYGWQLRPEGLIAVLGELRRFLGERPPYWDGCRPIAAPPCGPGFPPSGSGWWWSGCRPTRPTSTGRGAVVEPQGRGTPQPHRPDPGRGDRPGSVGHQASPPHAASGLLVLWHAGLSVA